MRAVTVFLGFCVLLLIAAGVFVFLAWRPAINPVNPPAANSFDPALVKRGAELAAIGNCDVCHTAPDGYAFAGGLPLPTQFGTIFSTNITPDLETGIGQWSEAAFGRAMREGVRRNGQYLYPAFPYDHFTLVTDDDDKALYAFLMTRNPVRATPPANTLPFPLNVRLVMFGWNVLFFRQGPYRLDPAHDEAWNRGAYLTEGLGHCGACHTPRNFLGAEERNKKLSGGEIEGWTAYALNASSPAPVPWTAEALSHYLHYGFEQSHGVARGPMVPVVDDLHIVDIANVQAIAGYIAAQTKSGTIPAPVGAQVSAQNQRGKTVVANSADSQADTLRFGNGTHDEGALLYAAACAGCHEGPRAMPYGGIDLALSSGVSGPTAQNLVNVVLYGLPASESARSPIMPGFAATMSDPQLVALATYLRSHFSTDGAWRDVEKIVHDARSAQRAATTSRAPTEQAAPPTMERTGNGQAQH